MTGAISGGRRVGGRWAATVVPPVVVFVVVLAAAEVAVRGGWVPSYLVPRPTDVLRVLGVPPALLPRPVIFAPNPTADAADLWAALLETAGASVLGFGLSVTAGLLAAVALSSSAWVQRAFYPYAVFFQTVPIIAVAPLLVIWFGYGLPTIVASAFIVSVFPVIANTLTGLRSTEPALRDLFRLYRAGPAATLLKLRLPSALPNILVGLRIAGGLAVIGAIVGEFIAGGGLGAVIDAARTQQRVEKVFAAVLLASLLGVGLLGFLGLLSRLLLRRWTPADQD